MNSINTYNQIERYRVNSIQDLEKVSRRNIAVFRRVLEGKNSRKFLMQGVAMGRLEAF